MRKIFTLLFLFVLVYSVFSQDVRMEKAKPNDFNTVKSPDWGSDIIVSAYEPTGPMAAIQANDGTIYVAVADTLSTANLGLVIFQSTNNGVSWSLYNYGLTYRGKYDKLKLVKTGFTQDSIYLFNQIGSNVYCWNFRNLTLNTVAYGGHRSFDAVGATTGALYAFVDTLGLPTIRRYASTDGGMTWGGRGTVTTSGVSPKTAIYCGDSTIIVLNYYGPVLADTGKSIIRSARYRQSTNGTIASSIFQDVITDTSVVKNEFTSSYYNGTVWLVYTEGTTGNINIKGKQSTNNGVNFGSTVDIAVNPNVDEYWFDITTYTGGFDLSYYSDSLQSGAPTNSTDKLICKTATYTATSFGSPTQVSQHPPFWSAKNYKPVLCELQGSDLAVFWVGYTGTYNQLYFERRNLISGILGNTNTNPNKYKLYQNYPNPFNPVTSISFDVSKAGFVEIKIYDILGKEINNLVSKNLTPGNYKVDFNGSNLSSGVYFYKLIVDGYSDVKKMILQK